MKEKLRVSRKTYETVFSFQISGTMDDPIIPTPPPPKNPFPPLKDPSIGGDGGGGGGGGWPPGITRPPEVPPVEGTRAWRQVVLRHIATGSISFKSGDGVISFVNEEQVPGINAYFDDMNDIWHVGANYPENPGDTGAEVRGGPGLFYDWKDEDEILGMYPVDDFGRQSTATSTRLGYYGTRFDPGNSYPTFFFVPGDIYDPNSAIYKNESYVLEMVGDVVYA